MSGPMILFSPEDQRHLKAAEGWCGLNAFLEANNELEEITPQARAHPKVLEIRWQIYANLKKWDVALEIAKALQKLAPKNPKSSINLGINLQSLNRNIEAYNILFSASKEFPKNGEITYQLACVCCKLQRIPEAEIWLKKAIDLGGKEIKLRALDNDDLDSIWNTH